MMELNELITKYQKSLLEKKKMFSVNAQIDAFQKALSEQELFDQINTGEVANMLLNAGFNEFPIENVKTTLEYVKKNRIIADGNNNVQFIQNLSNLFAHLNKLRYPIDSYDALNKLLVDVKHLLIIINRKRSFLGEEEINLILKIIKEINMPLEKVLDYLKEVDEYNKEVLLNLQIAIDEDYEYRLSNDVMAELFRKHQFDLSQLSNQHLDEISRIPEDRLDALLSFIRGKKELNFIDRNYKKYSILLVTLLTRSNEEVIDKTLKAIEENKLDITELDPAIFVLVAGNKKRRSTSKLVRSVNVDESSNKQPITNKKNAGYFDFLQGSHEFFLANIEIMKSYGYDSSIYNTNSLLMLMPTDRLKENILVLEKNGLKVQKDPNQPIKIALSCLIRANLFENIDLYKEAGLFDVFFHHQSRVFVKDTAFFQRIYYARKNNLQIRSKFREYCLCGAINDANGYGINADTYKEMTEIYDSPIGSENVFSNIIIDPINVREDILNSPLIQVLDSNFKYLDDGSLYQIADVLVSRDKVLRLLQGIIEYNNTNLHAINLIEGILYAINYKLLYNKEEHDELNIQVINTLSASLNLTDEQVKPILIKMGINLAVKETGGI